jgi:hypothetical protein
MFMVLVHETPGLAQIGCFYIAASGDSPGEFVRIGISYVDLSDALPAGSRYCLAPIGEELINMSWQQLELPPF